MSTSLIVFEDPRRASDELFEQVFGEEVPISISLLRDTYVYSETRPFNFYLEKERTNSTARGFLCKR